MSVHFGMRRSTVFANKPVLTEHNLPDQYGKVFIVTGGSGGVGSELVDILFQHNARIYIATRSESKTTQLINRLKAKHPNSKGELIFLKLTLDDLTTIKASAEEFLSKESRLDVLWNNAGVMIPPEDQRTKQGYEMQLGINNLGHFVFTHALEDVLKRTAASAPKNSVRVIWVASSAADAAPNPPIDFANITYEKSDPGMWQKYTASKAGSVLYSTHFSKRNKGSGVISLALNPGNFVTDLQQHMPKGQLAVFKMIAHPPRNGGYTELFAGLSDKITEANNGGWVSPHGRIEPVLKQLGNPETAKKYWDWSENEVRQYL